jgi:hypothetical protein
MLGIKYQHASHVLNRSGIRLGKTREVTLDCEPVVDEIVVSEDELDLPPPWQSQRLSRSRALPASGARSATSAAASARGPRGPISRSVIGDMCPRAGGTAASFRSRSRARRCLSVVSVQRRNQGLSRRPSATRWLATRSSRSADRRTRDAPLEWSGNGPETTLLGRNGHERP